MATTNRTKRGFKVNCPFCGEDGNLRLEVEDVHSLTCSSCDAEFTTEDIRQVIDGWRRLLAWLDAAPELGG